jgi:hypothetical protein
MENRWTIEELERMTPREVADLLSNIVMVLRGMPNVPITDLKPVEREYDASSLVEGLRHDTTETHEARDLPGWLGDQ